MQQQQAAKWSTKIQTYVPARRCRRPYVPLWRANAVNYEYDTLQHRCTLNVVCRYADYLRHDHIAAFVAMSECHINMHAYVNECVCVCPAAQGQ